MRGPTSDWTLNLGFEPVFWVENFFVMRVHLIDMSPFLLKYYFREKSQYKEWK